MSIDSRRRLKRDVSVELVCGCRIGLQTPPLGPGAKFTCPNGMGHGYNVGWLSWTDYQTGRTGTNQ